MGGQSYLYNNIEIFLLLCWHLRWWWINKGGKTGLLRKIKVMWHQMVRGFCCHLVGTWGSLKWGFGSRNGSEKQSLWNLSPKGSKWLLTEMCVIFSLLSCCLKCKQKLDISLASQASLFISYFGGCGLGVTHAFPWPARTCACLCVCVCIWDGGAEGQTPWKPGALSREDRRDQSDRGQSLKLRILGPERKTVRAGRQ